MDHMTKNHSFFIPDMEYMIDLKGLIAYLADKIAVENICIYCNGKGRTLHSIEAVRKHMADRGHWKIKYEDGAEDEIAQFYDFSSTWEDIEGSEGDVMEEVIEEEDQDDEDELAHR